MTKVIVGAVFVTLVLSGCSQPTEVRYNSAIDGETVTFSANQKFSLQLDVNADAGEQWECEISDTTVVSTDGNPSYKSLSPGATGGETMETIYFRANMRGQSSVTLIEQQPWEKDVPPTSSIQFIVLVR